MKWSLYLGKIAGIKVFIHWTFLILLGWIGVSGAMEGQNTSEITWSMIFILSAFACITLHELGHALAARRYGISTSDITLLPIGGVARLQSMPKKPAEELVVALAGPLVNVLIAILLFLVLPKGNPFTDMGQFARVDRDNFLVVLFSFNVIIPLFNMIPAFPMDGGRVLRALLAFRLDRVKATRIAAKLGQLMAMLFVFAGFMGNPFLIFIGLFIFLGAEAEYQATAEEASLAGHRVSDVLMKQYISIDQSEHLRTAVDAMLNGQCRIFLVTSGLEIVGSLNRDQIIAALMSKGSDVTVGEVMNSDVCFLHPETSLTEAYSMMKTKGDNLYPVTDDGKLEGVLDLENIMEYVMVQNALLQKGGA